jgi:hypothetical protein
MWIKLLRPHALFYRVEPAGSVHSFGTPLAKQLVVEGKAIEVVCPGSGDPDDIAGLRERFRKANGPLWDECERSGAQPTFSPQAAKTIRKDAAAKLKEHIDRLLGPRSAKATRERISRQASRRGRSATPSSLKSAAKRLASQRSVTTKRSSGIVDIDPSA